MTQPLKWHGGKHYLADWIIGLMPPRSDWHLYREPYFGGGAVLFALDPRGLGEAVNDINGDLITFWRVLSKPNWFEQFRRRVEGMPFDQSLWDDAKLWIQNDLQEDCVERALEFFVRYRQSRQGLGKDFATPTTRLRRGMSENVSAWLSAVEGLPQAHNRLKRVEIRHLDALDFIRKYDDKGALFYCDPPYLHSTRTAKDVYECEMDEQQHTALLQTLSQINGKFMLSGYHSELYDTHAAEHGWRIEESEIDNKAAGGSGKRKMTECIWMNYKPTKTGLVH